MPQVASVLKNKSMKAFHDSQVEFATIDYMEAFDLKRIKRINEVNIEA